MKTFFALAFTLIVSASIPAPVFAAASSRSKPVPVKLGGFSLSPTISGYLFSGSEKRDATQSYGLKVGYDKIGTSIADSLGVEGSVNYFTSTSKAAAGDAGGYIFRLDAIYPFILGAKWMPFLAIGGGGIFIDSASHVEKSPLLDYGAGLKYFPENYLAVRMDVRQLIVYSNVNTRNNFEVGIGISYYFGKERKKKPVPPPKQEEKKDAKRGLAIPAIEEVATTAGAAADGEKKPALQGETGSVPPSSSLIPLLALSPLLALESSTRLIFQTEAPKEGVGVKYMVREVSPAKVETVPAAAGENPPIQIPAAVVAPGKTAPSAATIPSPVIPGERKPEPGLTLPMAAGSTQPSPAKTAEPLLSAVEKKVVRKLSVEFNPDSSYIKPEFHNKIVELADIMKSSDSISARIEGYPDSIVDSNKNSMLTEKRVERVRDSLINLGANPDRISTIVYEPPSPIVDNATAEGSQKNQPAVTLVTLTGEFKIVPAPVTAGAAAPLKSEPAPAPAEEKKPLPVTVPVVAPAPPAPVGTVPPVRTEAVPAPVSAGEIPAPARVETAPPKSEPAPAPAEEKKPLQVTAPGAVPAPPVPPPAPVETVPPVRTEAVPAPVSAGEIPAPARVETAPLKSEAVPTPVEGEKPARRAVAKKAVRKLTVEFDVNSSYIKPKYYLKLGKIADIMKSSADASARIEGHADSSGRLSYNIKLSKQRAQSVRSSLIKLGVAPDRISAVGYGPSRPTADNATVEGRRRNRRAVTFVTLTVYE